jgi:alpha,alpha-trehalase
MPVYQPFFIEQLSDLYVEVQSRELFPDSKFFVDAVPKQDPAAILLAYEKEKQLARFDLKTFTEKHFILPQEAATNYDSANKPIYDHLQELWDLLKRAPGNSGGTLIPLPYPYIVPGGRFREIYYWDSYFTMLGLQVSKRTDIIQNMIDNFAYLIDEVGFIPNGNRSYYLGRSQPPFFALMILLLSEEKGLSVLETYLPQLEKEYRFWMDGADRLGPEQKAFRRVVQMPDGSLLNRYWDDHNTPRPEAYTEDTRLARQSSNPRETVYRHIRAAAESGWDFSSRWFEDGQNMATIQTTDLVPVDLNCIILFLEETLLKCYTRLSNRVQIDNFSRKTGDRKKAINRYCWNETAGFYFDYHHPGNRHTQRYTLAAVFPLFSGIASGKQAEQVALQVARNFLQIGGVLTTLAATGQQWDAPNGWAPLQWITYKGLKNYGHTALAKQVRDNWMANNEKIYATTGKMMEKYNVLDTSTRAGGGEYPNQDGFGWTNGVYLKLLAEKQASAV